MNCSNLYLDENPRKRSFKVAKKLITEYINCLGKLPLDQVFKLLQSEKLKSKYRREPRAIKRKQTKYCQLAISRKDARKLNWKRVKSRGSSQTLMAKHAS